ncbi:sensor histidine kinase [Pelagibius sp.]|uniref:sensor histidine kinase n=1 Tax=Pelagibius sp. TaxID=1931238 RepID=UPI003BB07A0A
MKKILRWTSGTSNRTAVIDLAIALGSVVVAFAVFQEFDLAEAWEAWADQHEDMELDELPLALGIAAIAFLWFSWRRWCALAKEFRRSRRIMTRLRASLRKRRAAERSLISAKQEAELADRTKSEFLANISHELRTPLNAIIGFSEVIVNQVDGPMGNPKYQEYATHICESGKHLLGIINEILDLSKIESGQAELVEETFTPRDSIQAAIRLVSMQSTSTAIDVELQETDGLPDFHGDPRLLKQIVINLVSNAVKFSKPGGKVTVSMDVGPERGLRIAIQDTGVGMTADEIAIAIKPFRQIENAYKRSRPGTGLGLPLALALTELHGGTVALASDPGQGTTVTVTFPAARSVWAARRPKELGALA